MFEQCYIFLIHFLQIRFAMHILKLYRLTKFLMTVSEILELWGSVNKPIEKKWTLGRHLYRL